MESGNDNTKEVIDKLKECYKTSIKPLEEIYKFDYFYDTPFDIDDFDAKPMVLILGQYSVGKTSFIKNIIGREFPGMRVGPEPTTDKFTCIFHDPEDSIVSGDILALNPELPFHKIDKFGDNFIDKFEGSCCSSNILKTLTFVDTPGILSHENQEKRKYNFNDVTQYFANKASRILLIFDCNKLEISDEFKKLIYLLKKNKNSKKIRIILNKSDTMSEEKLMRVYGALMWNLGKILKTPEVARIYVTAFDSDSNSTDKNLKEKEEVKEVKKEKENVYNELFKREKESIYSELKSLSRKRAQKYIIQLLKRAKIVKLHINILLELRTELPKFYGKKLKQKEIIDDLESRFKAIAKKLHVRPADFPSIVKFKRILEYEDLSAYPKLNIKKMKKLEMTIEKIIPNFLNELKNKKQKDGLNKKEKSKVERKGSIGKYSKMILGSRKEVNRKKKIRHSKPKHQVHLPSVEDSKEINRNRGSRLSRASRTSEYSHNSDHPQRKRSNVASTIGRAYSFLSDDDPETRKIPRKTSHSKDEWVVGMVSKTESDNIFYKHAVDGQLYGQGAHKAFIDLGLPAKSVVLKIWKLIDFYDKNEFDAEQFALAFYLAKLVKEGGELPDEITWAMLPPSHRD